MSFRVVVLRATLLSSVLALGRAARAQCVSLTANLDVFGDVTICPGTYDLDDPENDGVIRVRASNIAIDMSGVTLHGSQMQGFGVRAQGFDNVIVRGATIRGYKAAVYLSDGTGHLIEGSMLSFNRKRPVTHSPADFLAVWPDLPGQISADQIGDGVLLSNVTASIVRQNVLRDQQNGIGLFECSTIEVSGNDCSNNEGWGIHVHRSSFNVISGNVADANYNKVSTYCHDVQQDGCDTAALLLIKDSNDNVVTGNSLRNSGDGVFSAAREGATQWGADRNEYIGNDCRFAKHIGLESTFSDQNVFRWNLASNCGRYGFWLGYSRNARVLRNEIHQNATAGISNESTVGVVYEGNDIRGNPIGVDLRRGTFSLLAQGSSGQVFRRNRIAANTQRGLSIVDTQDVLLEVNHIEGNGGASGGNLYFGKVQEATISGPLIVRQNNVLGLALGFNVWNQQPTAVDLRENWWGTTDSALIASKIRGISEYAVIPAHRVPRLEIVFQLGSDGPYTLRRVVNERADDANDADVLGARKRGNADSAIYFGRGHDGPAGPSLSAGFRFRDVWLPSTAAIVSAALVVPTEGPAGNPLELRIAAEASDDARPFEAGALPLTRPLGAASVPWSIVEPWTDMGWANSPELRELVVEVLSRPGWQPGNAIALQVSNVGSAKGTRSVWAFERAGYSAPYGFQHYRKHRFTKLEVEYRSSDGRMVLEREVPAGTSDADNGVGGNEVHFGFTSTSLRSGFRFEDVRIPPDALLTRANLVLATDGTYTNVLTLALRGEKLLAPPPYAPGNMPANRPATDASTPWTVSETWQYLQWHLSPDVRTQLAEIRAMPGWTSGNPVAIDVLNSGSTGHRRVWAFERQPRIDAHDFPEIGATPFVPFLTGPVVL